MGGNIELTGSIIAGANCGGCGDGGSTKVQALKLACAQAYAAAVVSTDVPLQITSPNAFVDLPLLEQLGAVEFLFAQFNTGVVLRVGAEEAILEGSGGTFPTTFAGGETVSYSVDAYGPIAVTFQSGDQSAQQVAARMNAAAALASVPFLPVTVSITGQLRIAGVATGDDGLVGVTGSVATVLGFGTSNRDAVGAGEDLVVNGLFMCEFNKSSAPARIQMKGTASAVTLMAAGPSATG